MTAAPFLSRHFGDYLLVAQLSEDVLGTVFRALYAADERRFVRLRILHSDELAPEAILETIAGNVLRDDSLVHDAIVVRPQLDLAEDLPFMTWDETAGWTLDTMLARVRAFGVRIPVEYALLIGERIAAALEHAHQTWIGGRPVDHGLLWPGFVSISHDAAVRVGGFGIAEGILPSLNGPRMTAEIAPYVAPEVRIDGRIGANADVYSLGAILVELTTGRRPSIETPSVELRAGDPRSDELGTFLRRCLAAPEERFASATDAHRALQQMVTGNPYSLYTANLALFLYKLLNPESQTAAPSADWESTNPVIVDTAAGRADAQPPPLPTAQRGGNGDLASVDTGEPETAPPGHWIEPTPLAEAPAVAPESEPQAAESEPRAAASEELNPWHGDAPLPAASSRPALALAAAAGITLGVVLLASQLQWTHSTETRRVSLPSSSPASVGASTVSAVRTDPGSPLPEPPAREPEATSSPAAVLEKTTDRPLAVRRPAAQRAKPETRQPAEDLRLRAALARIEADRLNAKETAGELFGEGRHSEEEGEKLLRQRDYDAAQLAFSRAARLFQQATEITWEERLRQTNLSSGQ